MLQQTRVETVLPYYERFVARFPDVEALAAAPVDEVLSLWSGLGYYRRARQMHAAARQVAADGGRFPETRDGLLGLPGIGPYTAAAVASICFGEPVAVLDGNVERVAARLLALDVDPKTAAARRRLLAVAEALIDPARPGDSNQALMELGAGVCTPRRPRCLVCPLREPTGDGPDDHAGCAARACGDPERYPPPRSRRSVVAERRLVAVVARDEPPAVLLFRRPADEELMAGLWELPWAASDGGDAAGADEAGADEDGARLPPSAGLGAAPSTCRGAAEALRARYGAEFRLGERCGEVRHGVTHRALTLDVRRAQLLRGPGRHRAPEVAEPPAGREARWVPLAGLAELPLSSMVAKALALALPQSTRGLPGGITERRRAPGRRRRA